MRFWKIYTNLLICLLSYFNCCKTKAVAQSSVEKLTGSLIQYACKIFQKTNISYPLIRTRTCPCQGLRNISLSENFVHVLNVKDSICVGAYFQFCNFIKYRAPVQMISCEFCKEHLWVAASRKIRKVPKGISNLNLFRSSRPRLFFNEGVLKFRKIHKKASVPESLFNKKRS